QDRSAPRSPKPRLEDWSCRRDHRRLLSTYSCRCHRHTEKRSSQPASHALNIVSLTPPPSSSDCRLRVDTTRRTLPARRLFPTDPRSSPSVDKPESDYPRAAACPVGNPEESDRRDDRFA